MIIGKILTYIKIIKISDLLDMILISYFIYKGMIFLKDTRTFELLKGLILFFIIIQISYFLNLYAVNYILNKTIQIGAMALVLVFQPELRKGLEHLGKTSIGKWFLVEEDKDSDKKNKTIKETLRALDMLSKNKIGALIVIERQTKINDIILTGTPIKAVVSAELLFNIFVPKTPLHDGAVVIKEDKIESATCFLPLSQNRGLSKKLGTRHRAGIGLSEETDSIVLIVSEETGEISVALNGVLHVNYSKKKLEKILRKEFKP